MIDND